MESLDAALIRHTPWYDSFDQNTDSWGCSCNKQTGYRSRDEVVIKHISPIVREIVSATKDRLDGIESEQKRRDVNGNLLRGMSNRGAWESVDRLVQYCKSNKLDNLAQAFEGYEDERKRLNKAIENLESQLTAVCDTYRESNAKYALLDVILKEAGIDPDVLIKTHNIFSEKP